MLLSPASSAERIMKLPRSNKFVRNSLLHQKKYGKIKIAKQCQLQNLLHSVLEKHIILTTTIF